MSNSNDGMSSLLAGLILGTLVGAGAVLIFSGRVRLPDPAPSPLAEAADRRGDQLLAEVTAAQAGAQDAFAAVEHRLQAERSAT